MELITLFLGINQIRVNKEKDKHGWLKDQFTFESLRPEYKVSSTEI